MTEDLSLFYFPAALALGALHALEPGHAKALTASYLIGIKGTKRDSVILGLSVAVTHSLVVIGISLIGLWLGNEAFTGEATAWLERGSGLVAILIGSWMLYRRLFKKKRHTHHSHGHKLAPPALPQDLLSREVIEETKQFHFVPVVDHHHNHGDHHHHDHHDHDHLDDEAHARAHAETLPEYVNSGERPSVWQIISFGAAGGMIPCPASITVMLLALSTGRAALGLFTVLGFSLGLALALVGVGMAIVTGLSKLSDTGRLSWVTKRAPAISAGLVILSGVAALVIAH